MGVGVSLGELAVEVGCFLAGGEGGLVLPRLGELVAEVGQCSGEVGEVGVGVAVGELAVISAASWLVAKAA